MQLRDQQTVQSQSQSQSQAQAQAQGVAARRLKVQRSGSVSAAPFRGVDCTTRQPTRSEWRAHLNGKALVRNRQAVAETSDPIEIVAAALWPAVTNTCHAQIRRCDRCAERH